MIEMQSNEVKPLRRILSRLAVSRSTSVQTTVGKRAYSAPAALACNSITLHRAVDAPAADAKFEAIKVAKHA